MAAQTNKLPSALAARTELFPDMQYYFNAFWELSFQRPNNGFGVMAIPYVEIVSYCDLFNVNNRDVFTKYIKTADFAYITVIDRKSSNGRCTKN